MSDYKFTVLNRLGLYAIVTKVQLITSVIFVLLVLMLFLPWQQTVKGQGVVTALDPTQRDYNVLATIDGIIKEFHVKENQFVKKGTKLFTMVDLDQQYLEKLQHIQNANKEQYNNTKLQIQNLHQRKQNLTTYLSLGLDVYTKKSKTIKNKIKSLQYKKASLEKNFTTSKANYTRTKTLFQKGIESKRVFEVRENIYIKAQSELRKVVVDIQIENTNILILENEKKQFLNKTNNRLKSLENSILLAQNKLNTLQQQEQLQAVSISRYTSGEVFAQKDGYVVKIYQTDKNKFIKRGTKVIFFSPKVTKKSILLKVSDFNMPLIKQNLSARIMFYGWPALQVSGWPKIKYGTFSGSIKKVEHTSHEKGFYYAQILENETEPWPEDELLRVGTQAVVWVKLSTVPIWYQLWRTMNALPPKMLTPTLSEEL